MYRLLKWCHGSGVNDQNALKLAETGINNLHFTATKSVGTQKLGMGIKSVVDEAKIKSIVNLFN